VTTGPGRSAPHEEAEAVAAREVDPVGWILGLPSSRPFFDEHLGKTWYHARPDDPRRFGALLSLADLDEVLGRFGVRHPGIKLVRSDGPVPVAEYLWRDNMVDPARVARLFSEGCTVVFGSFHDWHEPLRRLCSAVSGQASARTQTNIYLTPPSSQGFKPHWDTHDVFVLQVEGSKRWRIYGGGPELPLKDQKFDPALHVAGDVEHELTLREGEALYIPRGIMHAAVTTEDVSLHVTLGVMAFTWAELVVDCLAELVERDPRWRENVPFGFAGDGRPDPALASELAERLSTLSAGVDLHAVVPERRRTFSGHLRPRATDYLQQAASAPELRPEDEVRWRESLPGRIEHRNGRVVVASGDREIELPAAATATLERMLAGVPLVGGAIDDGLDWESRRVVLAALIREGWVARAGRRRTIDPDRT
jgi:hypothetical protein